MKNIQSIYISEKDFETWEELLKESEKYNYGAGKMICALYRASKPNAKKN